MVPGTPSSSFLNVDSSSWLLFFSPFLHQLSEPLLHCSPDHFSFSVYLLNCFGRIGSFACICPLSVGSTEKKKRHLHDWHLTLSIWPSCSSSDFLDLLTEPLCIPYKDEALRAVQHLFFSMPAAPMLPWLGVHCPEARTSPLSLHVYLLYDRESFDSFISPAQLRLFHDVVRCALAPAVSCQLLRQRVQFCRASPSPQGRL